jgi:hypothetical protein
MLAAGDGVEGLHRGEEVTAVREIVSKALTKG